jgi:plastocyanin
VRGIVTRPSLAALACALVFALGSGASIGAAAATTHTVVIDGVKYDPEALTVNRGDTVVWVNKDPFPHTVTSKGAFDSHSIAAGRSWKYSASKAGEFTYICTFHPNMKGTLTVK